MDSKQRKKKKAPPRNTPLPSQAISAYQESADPLGSYSGLTTDMRCMPRRKIDGKTYFHSPEAPVQDQDDL